MERKMNKECDRAEDGEEKKREKRRVGCEGKVEGK